MDLINFLKNKSVILVGSHPNVLNYKFGHIIDSFDVVIRFNCAHTKNIEEYIGSRTDIRVINTVSDYRKSYNKKMPEIKMSRDFYKDLRNETILKLWSNFPMFEFDKSNNIYIFKYNNFDSFLKTNNINYTLKLPRLGFRTLIWLLDNNIETTIHGFEFDVQNSLKISSYYFTQTLSLHQPKKEVEILNHLVSRNFVNVLNTNSYNTKTYNTTNTINTHNYNLIFFIFIVFVIFTFLCLKPNL